MFGFIKGPKKAKPLGRVQSEQMSFEDGSGLILQRISPVCEKCNSNKYYYVYKSYKPESIVIPIPFKIELIYTIVCPECGEAIELAIEEFEILRPIVNVNNKLEKGKISEMECKRQVEEILKKLRKKIIK